MVAVSIALVAILSLTLGVLSLRGRDRVRLTFSIFSFIVAAWVLVNFVFQVTGDDALVPSFYALGALAICSGLIFSFYFLFEQVHPLVTISVSLLGLINFALSLFSDLVIRRVLKVYATGYEAETGPYFLGYSLFIVAGVLAFFVVMSYQRRRSEGIKRNQISWIMAGFGAFGLVTAVVSFILPLFGVWNLTSFDSPSAIFFVLASFYAITRYRLFDLRIVVRKSVFYLMLAVFVFVVYYLNVYLDENVFGGQYTVGAYLSALVIAPLFLYAFSAVSKFLQKVVNKYFFTSLYDPQATIKEFASRISQTIRLDEVTAVILDTIQNTLRSDAVALVLKEKPDKNRFAVVQTRQFDAASLETLNAREPFRDYVMPSRQPVIVEEAAAGQRGTPELRNAFTSLKHSGMEVLLPLNVKDSLIGVVVIGRKATKEAYTKEDIELLGTLANQASVAVQNARLYNSMEEIVAEQTRDIKEKNLHLEELLKMKSEFLSIASHQLRTPLTAIRGLLSMQADGDLDRLPEDQRRQEQRHMLAAADHLNNIVNDLLDAMELEGGQTAVNFAPVDLGALIAEAIGELKPDFDKKGLSITFEKPAQPVPAVPGETKYLREAVMDVIDNAEKYTNKGGVTISLSSDGANAAVTVKDTGIGIPKSDFPRLFKKFSRGERSAFQHANGSGLGLFIIRNIMNRHHGDVRIESEGEGKGTTVTLTVPLKQPKVARN